MKRVYIETSIPSFYYEVREAPDMIARRDWTRQWWDQQRRHYECVTSMAVVEELGRGVYPGKADAQKMIATIPVLPLVDSIPEAAQAYISRKVMPRGIAGDAFHLAFASFYHCDFLLTWNCTNLANANKYEHIRRVNGLMGLFNPVLTTPFELMKWEREYEG
ncbi:MAG: type II toxin-antitoxin system VapC family toxin [Planctomycetota bacterium]